MPNLNAYRERPHWSFSSLNQILNICSLQFFLQRIARLETSFTPLPLSFGSAWHRTLEWVGHMRRDGHEVVADEAADLFNEVWKRQIQEDTDIRFNGTDADACAKQGMALTACFVENIDPEEQVTSVSETFAVPVTDADGNSLEKPLIGEIDCVVTANGRTSLVDWKTSARRWPKSQADRSLQPTAYLYAYGQLYPDDRAGFRFDILVKNKTPVMEQYETERCRDDFRRMAKLMAVADAMIENEVFHPAETSTFCAGCPFQDPCRAWHRKATYVSASAEGMIGADEASTCLLTNKRE